MYSEAETKFPPPPEEGAPPPPPVGPPAVGAESDGPPAVLAAEGLVGVVSSGLAAAVDMIVEEEGERVPKTVGEEDVTVVLIA